MNNASSPQDGEPVAVLTLRTVRPGYQEKFEEALHDFIAASFHAEGQLGVHVIRPASGSDPLEYGIVRRFASARARDSFYNSELFRRWEEKIVPLTETGSLRQNLSGLEAWFTLPGRRVIIQPSNWKMALITLAGVYPVSVVVPWLLHPLIGNLHPLLQAFFIAVGIVAVLTWAVMPVLVKIFQPWLYPREEKKNERTRSDSS